MPRILELYAPHFSCVKRASRALRQGAGFGDKNGIRVRVLLIV